MADRRTDNDPDFNPDEQQMLEVADEGLNTSGGGGDHHDDAHHHHRWCGYGTLRRSQWQRCSSAIGAPPYPDHRRYPHRVSKYYLLYIS